jgi:superfamily II DNA or RNA helicase
MKAYYNEWLLLPKKRFNTATFKNALTYPLKSRDRITGYLKAYKEDGNYFYAPREFLSEDKLLRLNVPLEYQLPVSYQKVRFKDSITLDALDPQRTIQRQAFAALKNHAHGVLSLACGRGKTVVSLKYVSFLQRPALVIVETTALVNQWAEQAQRWLGLKSSQIGIIQGHPSKWDTKRPITIATIQSLARHADKISGRVKNRFGLVIWDECHHLSAPHYNKTAAMFPGLRLGLSATPERLDGLESLYYAHIGNIVYQDLSQDLVPAVNFHEVNLGVDWNSRTVLDEILDRTGELSWTRLWGFIGQNPRFQDKATQVIQGAVAQNRKVLVLSNRLKTVKLVADALNAVSPGIANTITGRTKQADRLTILRNSQVVVGITKIAREGLDEPALDTLVLLEPFSDPHTLRQTVGRILRECTNKRTPEVHVIVGRYDACRRMMYAMRKNFNQWPRRPTIRMHT